MERYRTLLEINNAIISNLTEEALFRVICAAMRRIIPNDRSAIFLPDVHRDVLCLFAIDSSIESQRFLVGAAMDSKDSHAGCLSAISGHYCGATLSPSASSPPRMRFSPRASVLW